MIYKTKHTKLSEKYPTLLSFFKYSFEIFRFQCYLLRRNLCLLLPPSLPPPLLYSMGSSYYVEAGLKLSVSRSKIQPPPTLKRGPETELKVAGSQVLRIPKESNYPYSRHPLNSKRQTSYSCLRKTVDLLGESLLKKKKKLTLKPSLEFTSRPHHGQS